ncbi:MAG: DegV family EDD domain-containing protein [Caldilineaceae bacterium]|nr:DegV family EDD domain-containing protein [Caldilineaceae bacterium]
MTNVRIITDSNAYLPADFLERYPVEVIPHRLKIGGSFFEEDADFPVDEFFEKIADARRTNPRVVPEVQAPPVNTFLDQFQNGGTEQIVAIHMSSQLSPMWQQARKAAEMLKGRYTIRVLDSQTTSFGLGLLVRKAAEAAANGAALNDIARIVNSAVPHMYVTIFTESLSYLERSARLSASQSLLGAMLGIKAMLMMEDGWLVTQEKVQTREEVVEKLREFVSEFASIREIGVFHQGYESIRTDLIGRLRESLPKAPIHKVDYPPSLASYIGPNTVGVVVYEGTY